LTQFQKDEEEDNHQDEDDYMEYSLYREGMLKGKVVAGWRVWKETVKENRARALNEREK
jgi:hypothetical protein